MMDKNKCCNTFCDEGAEYQVYYIETGMHGKYCTDCSNDYRVLDNFDITPITK
mgnify:CR=1 FL=1